LCAVVGNPFGEHIAATERQQANHESPQGSSRPGRNDRHRL
jgi:hypothetical protein